MWRADQDKASAQTWDASDDKTAAGVWGGGRAIPFIKSLLGRKRLVMRVTPYEMGAREMEFNIAGLDQVVEPLRTACKW
jgi:type VI secretion system protein VasI